MANFIDETENGIFLALVLLVVVVVVGAGYTLKGIFSGFSASSVLGWLGIGSGAKKSDGSPATISGGEAPAAYALDLGVLDEGLKPLQLFKFGPEVLSDMGAAYSLYTTEGDDLMTFDFPLSKSSGGN